MPLPHRFYWNYFSSFLRSLYLTQHIDVGPIGWNAMLIFGALGIRTSTRWPNPCAHTNFAFWLVSLAVIWALFIRIKGRLSLIQCCKPIFRFELKTQKRSFSLAWHQYDFIWSQSNVEERKRYCPWFVYVTNRCQSMEKNAGYIINKPGRRRSIRLIRARTLVGMFGAVQAGELLYCKSLLRT